MEPGWKKVEQEKQVEEIMAEKPVKLEDTNLQICSFNSLNNLFGLYVVEF